MIDGQTRYNETVVRYFIVAAVAWGVVSMLIGVLIAAQLYWPALNFGSEYFNYGKLRPLHTNGVIYGFGTCMLMGTSLYIVQRTGKTGLLSDRLAYAVFYGWQLVLLAAVVTLPLGLTTSKEYAELEWPVDVLIAVTWVGYAVLFFGTLAQRQVKHIFVANWFFGAFIIVIAVIFVVNNLAIPVGLTKSYSVFAGTQDAMAQWWWGHNAVGFLLTAGFIGMNYYFVPKVAERPIYSYRLSILHFWSIVAFYTWLGSHHLIYSTLPVWMQNIGIAMSIILWLPSWAGAYNSGRTILLNREKLRTDYILMFFMSAVVYYALATFEGPLLSIRPINVISHNTDWTIGHVHSGALGWVGMSVFATLYYLVPKLWRADLAFPGWIKYHFWLAHIGVAIYIVAMWVAGIGQGVLWMARDDNGTLLYSFMDALRFTLPWYLVRAIGGAIYLLGVVLMTVNLAVTVRRAVASDKLAAGEQRYA